MPAKGEATTPSASLDLLYNISRQLTAALDMHNVLQRVLNLSMSNVGAVNGSIIVLDESGEPVDGIIQVGDRTIDNAAPQLRETLKNGLAGWVASNQQGALIPDTTKDARWLMRPDDEQGKNGAKSALSVPLVAREKLVGVLTLVHPTPGFFTPAHGNLIQAIADQAGIAVLNARLYEESQRRTTVMTALAESASVITASLELDELLQRILTQISAALHVEVVSLALIDPNANTLTFKATSVRTDRSIIGRQVKVGEGLAGWVAKEGKGVIIPDASQDERLSQNTELVQRKNVYAIACAPLQARGQVIGILEAINPLNGRFDPGALEVLSGIGSFAGTAIDHARLFEQLQAAHERYHQLFEDSIDSIIITDRLGRILEVNRNAEVYTGFDRSNLIGKSIDQLINLDQDQLDTNFENTLGKTLTYESEFLTDHEKQIPIQVYCRSVDIEDGSNIQWLLRDITERKRLDRLREDLISMIYHDLRSPLANVVSSLDVFNAMLPEEGDPAYRSLLNIALRSTERIQRLTNSLLDMSRLESGQPIVNLFATSPLLLAVDAVEAVSPVAETKNQTINLSLPTNLPPVQVDGDMIRRVLVNLLENAVKYSPPGGEITLGAKTEGDTAQIWVQDTGPGIPPSEQEYIFDKYTRLNPEGSQKGFGLGLAYCRLAIEGHGGQIWIESESGQGSRFCFTLPLVKS